MDKTRGREKEKVKQKNKSELLLNIAPEKLTVANGILKNIRESRSKAFKEIQHDAHSFFSNKQMLWYVFNLADIGHMTAEWAVMSMFAIDAAQTKIMNLEKIVGEIAQKLDIDLKSVKAEVDSLKTTLDSPMITNVSEFIQKMKELSEKGKKAMENYVQ